MFLSFLYPSPKIHVIGECVKDQLIYLLDVFGVSNERCPSEGASALTEHWSDVLLDESRKLERFFQPGVKCFLSDVVAIFEDNSASATHIDHGLDMSHDAFAGHVEISCRIRSSELVSFLLRQSSWVVSAQWIVGRSLIRNNIRND